MSINISERLPAAQTLRSLALETPRPWPAAAAGAVAYASIWALTAQWQVALLAGWDAAALTWVILTLLICRGAVAGPDAPRADDPANRSTLTAVIVAALLGFAVALGLAGAIGQPHSAAQAALVALAMLAVALSALLAHLECRLHAARLHERGREPGSAPAPIAANATPRAADLDFWQFAYYALPLIPLRAPRGAALVPTAIAKLAALQSALVYAAAVILICFALSLAGPALNVASIAIRG